MKLINSNLLRSALTLALLGGGVLAATPEAKAQQVLIESDRLLEYNYRWQGHSPIENESECFQKAGEALRSEMNQMSNISQFDSFTNSNSSRSLSNKYEGIGKYIKNTTTFTDESSSSGSFSAAQRGLVVSVSPEDFKPNTYGSSYKRDQLTGKRESKCWGTLRYEFVVYGPNSITALTSSNPSVPTEGGSRLESRLNGKCLYTGHGGSDNVMVVPCDRGKTAGKDWRLTKNRQLQSVLNGKCLYTGHGGSDNVAVVPCGRGVWKGKQWQLTKNNQLQSVLNGKCLYTGHSSNPDNVAVVPCDRGVWKGKQWDGELLSNYSKKI